MNVCDICANRFGKPSQFCMSWHINVCENANKFGGILLVVYTGLWFHIYMVAAVFMVLMTSCKLHYYVMKTKYS